MADVNYSSLPFAEQIAFFLGKVNVPTQSYLDVWKDGHDTGFMVAGAYKAELLADLRVAIEKEIVKGTTLDEFRRDFAAIVDRYGWSYNGSFGWRTQQTYSTNLTQSYQAGRYAQLTDPEMLSVRPYWTYYHSDLVKVPRPQHLAWDGLTLPATDRWWLTHFPQNGWGCQCRVVANSAASLKRKGLKVDVAPPVKYHQVTVGQRSGHPRVVTVPEGIDPGFDHAPGATRADQVRSVLRQQLQSLPGDLAEDLRGVLDARPPVPPPPVAVAEATPQRLDEWLAKGKQLLDGFTKDETGADLTDLSDLRERILQALSERRSIDTPVKVNGAAADQVRRVSQLLPDDWTLASDLAGPLQAETVDYRSAYRAQDGGAGLVRLRKGTSDDSALHELVHRIQQVKPELDKLFQQLHLRRTAGEAAQVVGLDAETGRADHYVIPYQGREYQGRTDPALEVMAVAFQYALGGDPAMLGRLLLLDPEMLRLVLSTLWYFK